MDHDDSRQQGRGMWHTVTELEWSVRSDGPPGPPGYDGIGGETLQCPGMKLFLGQARVPYAFLPIAYNIVLYDKILLSHADVYLQTDTAHIQHITFMSGTRSETRSWIEINLSS